MIVESLKHVHAAQQHWNEKRKTRRDWGKLSLDLPQFIDVRLIHVRLLQSRRSFG